MLLRTQTFALFVMMALAASLQGTVLLQCRCSGRVVFGTFGKVECSAPEVGAEHSCPNCAPAAAPAPGASFCAANCWRVLDFANGQPQQAPAVLETPSPPTADFQEIVLETLPARWVACREPFPHRPPAPPGPPLTILYASLLV